VSITKEFSEILKDKEIGAVFIALPAEMHYTAVKDALLAGKNVFVEKPLSLDQREAGELIDLSHKMKSVLMVGHLLQYHPGFVKLKEITEKGELGKINYIYSSRLSLGKVRTRENIIWSFAPHDISMILSLANSEPSYIDASGGSYINSNIADIATIRMEFESGVKSHIFVSWLYPYKRHELVVIGDKKMAVFDDTKDWEDKLLIYPHEIDLKGKIPLLVKKKASKVAIEKKEPLKEECRHFIDCINNNKIPLTDGNEGLRVLKVLQYAQKSLDRN